MIIVKNFINKKLCQFLIKWHEEYWPQLDGNLTENHFNQNVINIHNIDKNEFKFIGARLNAEIQKISKYHYANYFQLTKWNTGCAAEAHKDIQNHIWSSILYLNDDYDGGETYYEDGSFFKPKQGRIIFFDGQYYKHGVKEVLRNPRYTLATWYKKIENNN